MYLPYKLPLDPINRPWDPVRSIAIEKSFENIQLSTENTCSPFSLTIVSRHKKLPKRSQDWAPKTTKMTQNLSSKVWAFLVRFLTSFWRRKCPKSDPKMTPKSDQMAPLGAQGGAWGGMGPQKGPHADLGVIWVSKMASKWPKMTPKWPQNRKKKSSKYFRN